MYVSRRDVEIGALTAVDAAEGSHQWTAGGLPVLERAPMVVGAADGRVYGFDFDGRRVWQSEQVVPPSVGVFSPLAAIDGRVFVAANTGPRRSRSTPPTGRSCGGPKPVSRPTGRR